MNGVDGETQANEGSSRRKRGLSLLLWILLVTVLAGGCLVLYQAVQWAREAAIASGSQSPFNQLQLAFRNYHEVYGSFPPAYVVDEAGNRMHSWRVLILPYIDGNELYKLYDFTEPWNGPNNRRLAHRMPRIFHCPSEPESDSYANTVVIVGSDTAFPGPRSTTMADFEDGLDNTILIAEITNSGVEWLEPRDLDVETMSFAINDRSKPSIGTARRNGPYVVFADYIAAYALTEAVSPERLRELTTVRGQEPLYLAHVQRGDFRGLISPQPGAASDADLANFKNWAGVSDVWLNRSPITDSGLAIITTAPNLSKVHLAHTAITDDGLKYFKGRSYLYSLDLSSTAITDAGLPDLADLVRMYYLDLRDTHVTLPGVARLLRVLPITTISFSAGTVSQERIDLRGSSATDADLEQFRGISKTYDVDVSRTEIDDAGVAHLRTLPALRNLDLSSSRVTDNGLEHLTVLPLLENVRLADLPISEAGVQHLARLTQLRTIDLSRSQVDDAALQHLSGLTKIWHLNLDRTRITDEGLDYLLELPALVQLNVHGTSVTHEAIERLRQQLPELTVTE